MSVNTKWNIYTGHHVEGQEITVNWVPLENAVEEEKN